MVEGLLQQANASEHSQPLPWSPPHSRLHVITLPLLLSTLAANNLPAHIPAPPPPPHFAWWVPSFTPRLCSAPHRSSQQPVLWPPRTGLRHGSHYSFGRGMQKALTHRLHPQSTAAHLANYCLITGPDRPENTKCAHMHTDGLGGQRQKMGTQGCPDICKLTRLLSNALGTHAQNHQWGQEHTYRPQG